MALPASLVALAWRTEWRCRLLAASREVSKSRRNAHCGGVVPDMFVFTASCAADLWARRSAADENLVVMSTRPCILLLKAEFN